jgi:hypothetical protein
MYQPIQLTIAMPSAKTLLSARRWGVRSLVILAAFVFSLTARAVTPAPDGGYPNQTTAEGENALFSLTGTTSGNTAVGFQALYSTTTGEGNTANGANTLYSNITGKFNTAIGGFALYSNTTGNYNAANGYAALYGNMSGSENVANGYGALTSNSTGASNTANGYFALGSNQTGSTNTATGHFALQSNIDGFDNTANGDNALFSNTGGAQNTANGVFALYNNTTGYNNTANGSFALLSNTTGKYNTATGDFALLNNTTGNNNAALGLNALYSNTTGNNNIGLGKNAGSNLTNGNNNIDIGNPGIAGESNKIRLGTKGTHKNTFIAGINGVTVAGGVGVIVDANGHLGTVTSAKRFKDAIKPMDKASEAILGLKPVTFRYKHELDPDGIPQFGLVAEQVEKVNPNLVARDEEGKVYTVRYEAVNAMLLNEFLKEHRKVEEQGRKEQKLEATIAQQQKEIKALAASLKEQVLRLQKVSDQLEMSKPAPQMVADNQ